MSELRAWARRDSGDQAPDAPAMPARDAPRFPQPIRDAETRIRKALDYRKRVDAVYAGEVPKPDAPDQPDKHTSDIAKRRLPEQAQEPDVAAKEKRRLSDKSITYRAMVAGWVINTAAEHLSVIPHSFANDVSGGLLILAAGIVLRRDKHQKDGNADRPED